MWTPLALLIPTLLRLTQGLRCFCTEEECTYGVCESAVCVVGIRTSGSVVRTCGAAGVEGGCRRGAGRWEEVCACTSAYCNSFAFLRHQIRAQRFLPAALPQDSVRIFKSPRHLRPHAHSKPPSNLYFVRPTLIGVLEDVEFQDDEEEEEEVGAAVFSVEGVGSRDAPSVFTLQSRPAGAGGGGEERRKEAGPGQASYLIVVLIIVPLVVGGSAVFLVAANYYCSLC